MKRILLGGRGSTTYALVDDEDYAEVSRRRWAVQWNGYAARGALIDGRHTTIRMHRQILGLAIGDERQGDHINYDRLDNRRENLRIVTARENLTHRRFVCVYWDKRNGNWRARATLNGRRQDLGRYENRDDALAAVAEARRLAEVSP